MSSDDFPLPFLSMTPTPLSNFAPTFNPFVPRPGYQGYCMPGMPQPLPVGRDGAGVQQKSDFSCKNCSKDFQSKAQYDAHMQHHQRCQHPGCTFEGTRKAVNIHAEEAHPVIHALVPKLETPEQIEKWRAERRRRFPTLENIKRKEAEQQDRRRRGQVAELEKFCHRRGSGQRRRGRGRGSNHGRRRNFSFERAYKQPYSMGEVTSSPAPSSVSSQSDANRTAQSADCGDDDSSSDEDLSVLSQHGFCGDLGKASLDIPFVSATGLASGKVDEKNVLSQPSHTGSSSGGEKKSQSVLQSLSIYDSTDGECSESDDEALQAKPQEVVGGEVHKDSALASKPFSEKTADLCPVVKCGEQPSVAENHSEGDQVEQCSPLDDDVGVSEKLLAKALANDLGQQGSWHELKPNVCTGSSGKRQQQQHRGKRKRKQPQDLVPYSKPTLLEKLLAPEVRRERNVILQCLRHIVQNDFFGVADTSVSSN